MDDELRSVIAKLVEQYARLDANVWRAKVMNGLGSVSLLEFTLLQNKHFLSSVSIGVPPKACDEKRFADVQFIWLPTLIPQTETTRKAGRTYIVFHMGMSHLLSFIFDHFILDELIPYIAAASTDTAMLSEQFNGFGNIILDGILSGVNIAPSPTNILPMHLVLARNQQVNKAIWFFLHHELGHVRLGHIDRVGPTTNLVSRFAVEEETPTAYMQMEFEADDFAASALLSEPSTVGVACLGVAVLARISDCESFAGTTKQTHPLCVNRYAHLLDRHPTLEARFAKVFGHELIKKYARPNEMEKAARVDLIGKFAREDYLSHYLALMHFIVNYSRKGTCATAEEWDGLRRVWNLDSANGASV